MADPQPVRDCFVVCPIGADGSEIRRRSDDVLRYIIKPAAAANALRVVRADDIAAPGSVPRQIIRSLVTADAVVADLTGFNPNVMYELGIRDSFRKATVLIAEEGTDLPFDLIQQRTIFFNWQSLSSADRARTQIEEALAQALQNPAGSSPVQEAADFAALERQDPERSALAEIEAQLVAVRSMVEHLGTGGERRPTWADRLSATGPRKGASVPVAAIPFADWFNTLTEAEAGEWDEQLSRSQAQYFLFGDDVLSREQFAIALDRAMRGFPPETGT